MCMYIGIEDLVANAFIELVDNSCKNEVLFQQLTRYGAEVVRLLTKNGKSAILILSEAKTSSFLQDYSDYFELFNSADGEGLRLKQGVTSDQLWERFRGYLSHDVMMAFMDKNALQELGIGTSVSV